MPKTALFDCAINEKCYSVDEGRGICLFFRPHLGGFDSSRVPTPREFAIQGQKIANARGSPRGWGGVWRSWN